MDAPSTNDRPVRWRRALALLALAPLAWGLLHLARLDPWRTEAWYARGVFPYVQRVQAALTSWSPVSMAEVVILVGLAVVALRCWWGGRCWRHGSRSLRNLGAHALAQSCALVGVSGITFQCLWGFNHARPTLAELIGLETGDIEVEELRSLVRALHDRASEDRPENSLLGALTHVWRWKPEEDERATASAWDRAVLEHRFLDGPRVRSKDALGSRLLTLAGLTGIYSPFTGEPHLNAHMPRLSRPFTDAHEIAHQRGIAREDEANFVAWLVCNHSTEPYHRYSGNLLALSYSISAWYGQQPEEARTEFLSFRPEVRRDLVLLWDFWRKRKSALSEVARGTNDLFLKGQGQESGARSYGRMVDLLVAWRRRRAD